MPRELLTNNGLRKEFTRHTPRGIINIRKRKLKYLLDKYIEMHNKEAYIELVDVYNTNLDGIDFKNLTTWGGLFTPEEAEVLDEFGHQIEISGLGKRRVNKFERL